MPDTEATFANYFELFEQPVQFAILQTQLDARLRQLQKQYHPDRAHTHVGSQADDADNGNVDSARSSGAFDSAVINQAYQTLSSPDSRAVYLLELSDQQVAAEQSIADLDFLDDAMSLRMALGDAIDANEQATLEQLQPQIEQRITAQSDQFEQAYQQQAWPVAIDHAQKLNFLVKLRADLSAASDQLSQVQDASDDDLYL